MDLMATLQWVELATRIAALHQYEPAMVLALIYMESRGNPAALNETSMATGLMQVMPREAGPVFQGRPTSRELLDPETNILWGLKILRGLRTAPGGTLRSAIYHYTGGKEWPSQEEFKRTYWLPFTQAWSAIERQLRPPGEAEQGE